MKKWFFGLGLLLIVVLIVEGSACGALAVLRAKHHLYELPHKTQDLDYATRKRIRHPILGWPLKEGKDAPGGTYRDATGARRSPAFPDPSARACVSLYGDSFIESVELDQEHAAANRLARALGCKVANFGQAGYGTDQSFMRYQLNPSDDTDIVILGHMLEDIERNLSRNRDLLTGGRDYNVKPRFILGPGGKLELIPMPNLSEQEYERTVGEREPLLKLEHESFQPGGDLVGPIPSFPFVVSLIKNLGNYGIRARLRGHHSKFADFYQADHPTHSLELLVAIIEAFRAETARRGKQGMVLLMPTLQDMTYHEKTGVWVHQTLVDRLRRDRVPFLDYAPYLATHHDLDFAAYFTPGGHYNELGDELLSRMLAAELAPQVQRAH